MGAVITRVSSILNTFLGKVLGLESGSFSLSTGEHTIKVPISFCAESVWVKFEGEGFDGCGQTTINQLGYTLSENSIIFEVIVKTNSCKISWFAVS